MTIKTARKTVPFVKDCVEKSLDDNSHVSSFFNISDITSGIDVIHWLPILVVGSGSGGAGGNTTNCFTL